MGACCGKPVQTEEQTSIPSKQAAVSKQHFGKLTSTLEGNNARAEARVLGGNTSIDARSAAAQAAEKRNLDHTGRGSKNGNLSAQLAHERKKSQNQLLQDAARETRDNRQGNLVWD